MSEDVPARRLPVRLIVLLFAGIFGVLALGYFLFLRPAYVVAFSNLRPADASAVVAQLEVKSIAYRLGDGGTTVFVPADEADQARLAIAGSDVALKGGVGFELFNKSDMGLTDFAQRINYQRALQGELERTIMLMDEVETARVHLAMPERALFRSERSPAKAAVELVAKPGRRLLGDKVGGIQRLVAFAVPDLAPSDVVVLDGDGRVLSPSSDEDAFLSPDAEERQAVQRYYRARVRAALDPAFPGLSIDVKVLVLGNGEIPAASMPAASATSSPSDDAVAAKPAPRSFRLRFVLATAQALNAEQETVARNLVTSAAALNEAAGDELTFAVGTTPDGTAASPPLPSDVAGNSVAAPSSVQANSDGWRYWPIAAIALIAAALAALAILSRARGSGPSLTRDEREAMVGRIRAALAEPEPVHAG